MKTVFLCLMLLLVLLFTLSCSATTGRALRVPRIETDAGLYDPLHDPAITPFITPNDQTY